MSQTFLQTLSRHRQATALMMVVAGAVAFSTVASHDAAFAQPSPPEVMEGEGEGEGEPDKQAAEQPAQQKQEAATGDNAAATPDGASDAAAGAAEKNAGGTPASAAESAEPTEATADNAQSAQRAGEDSGAAKQEQAAPQRAEADADVPAQAAAQADDAIETTGKPDTPPPSSPVAASPSEPAATEEAEPKTLTVATWSGAYGEAQRDVVIAGFKAARSVAVDVIERKNEEPIDLAAGLDGALPDAAEFSGGEIDAGCKAGQLAKLDDGDSQMIAPAIARDFLPGSLKPCGIGAFAWSHVFAVNPNAFKKGKPESLAEAFDTKRFPGKRAFLKKPDFLMEAALMADGANPEEVYELLASEAGRQRAFAKLDSLGEDIVWFDSAKAAMQALAKGEAAIGQSFSGRAFFSAARGKPVEIIWDGQIYAMTYWAIPSNSPRQALARAFLQFATQPQQLAAVAQRFPYGPTRTSAIALTERHATVGMDLKGFLPTAPGNMENALAADESWWSENRETIEAAFAEWMAKPKVKEADKSE